MMAPAVSAGADNLLSRIKQTGNGFGPKTVADSGLLLLLARKNKVCPIEVKSSGYRSHASLNAFSEKYSSRILNKYLVYTKDLGKDKDVLSIPVYMTMFL